MDERGKEKEDWKHRLRGQEIKEKRRNREIKRGRGGCNLVAEIVSRCILLLALLPRSFHGYGHCAGNIYENLHKVDRTRRKRKRKKKGQRERDTL